MSASYNRAFAVGMEKEVLMKSKYDLNIIKSRRKTISIRINPDCTIEVRCPLYMTKRQVTDFIESRSDWLDKHLAKMREEKESLDKLPLFTQEEIHELADKALAQIPPKVKHFADLVGVDYGRITIRNQKSRWGSCSSQGNLNFNCLLMAMPDEVIDYVVVHELCHRKEMNHSAKFWAEVESVLPDYKERLKWLKENGNAIMYRMTGSL